MARISGITLFAFVAIQIVALVAAQPNCGSLSLNGNTFNLNVLEQAAQPFQTQDTFGAYEFRVCSNFQCGSTPSAACQETSQPAMYSLGSWSPSTTAAYVNNAVVFTNSPTGSPPRGSTISVVCGQGVSNPTNFGVVSPAPGSGIPYIYQLSLTHQSGCPGGSSNPPGSNPPPPPAPHKKGLSGGSILLIIITVLLVVYLVGGALFLKFARGAEGMDIIPNREFWADLPSLCKDGVMFIVNKVRGGPSSYETVA